MLQILIQLLFIYFASLNFGFLFSKAISAQFQNPIKYLFIGLIFISIIGRLINFWFPLDEFIFFIFLFSSFLIFLFNKKKIITIHQTIANIINQHYIKYGVLFILVIYFSSLASISYDEGLYHAGFISWLNKYPLVKGIANIEFRYGFNSNWHLLSAIFNGYGLWNNVANCINTFLLLTAFLYLNFQQENIRTRKIFLFFPLIVIYHLIDPSADFAVFIFTYLFISELYHIDIHTYNLDSFWIFAIPFLGTVKMNSFLLIFLAIIFLYFLLIKNKSEKIFNYNIFIAYIILLYGTWTISNIIISGYIIFPYLDIPLFKPLWAILSNERIFIIKQINYGPLIRFTDKSYSQIESLSKLNQIKLWLTSSRLLEKIPFIFSLLSCIYLVFQSKKNINKLIVSLTILMTFIISSLMIIDLRFYAGIGFAAAACILENFSNSRKEFIHKLIYPFIFLQLILVILIYFNLYPKILNNKEPIKISLIQKIPYQYSPKKNIHIDNVDFTTPIGNEFSWDKIPSILKTDTSLHLITKRIEDGFYKSKRK